MREEYSLAFGFVGAFLVLFLVILRRRSAAKSYIVLDGSNVMHWRDNEPDIGTLREVIHRVKQRGDRVLVIFDANAGYLVGGRYLHDAEFARLLHLSRKQVMVVPKGQPADGFILSLGRDLRATIVSNDRFRDWAQAHPEVNNGTNFVRGGYDRDGLWLTLTETPRC